MPENRVRRYTCLRSFLTLEGCTYNAMPWVLSLIIKGHGIQFCHKTIIWISDCRVQKVGNWHGGSEKHLEVREDYTLTRKYQFHAISFGHSVDKHCLCLKTWEFLVWNEFYTTGQRWISPSVNLHISKPCRTVPNINILAKLEIVYEVQRVAPYRKVHFEGSFHLKENSSP